MKTLDGPTYDELKKRVQELEQAESDRKQAEKGLQAEKEKFRFLSENAPFGMVMISKDGTFKYINTKFNDIFGYDLNDIPNGKTWCRKAYPDPEYRHQVVSAWIDDLASSEVGQKRPRVFKVKCKNGSEKIANFIHVLLETGESLMTCENITKRKQAEEEREKLQTRLSQAQKMESIGILAGGIAHNFNNILMGIQGRISLMMMDKNTFDSDYEHLKATERYIKNAVELTRDLLGFAREGNCKVRPTDLNLLIKNENKMFGRARREVRINGRYEKDLWIVEVDQNQIKQALFNLYVNAWQAMPGGGALYIQTENVTLNEKYNESFEITPGKYIKVSVTDTGIGIDEATRERIFDPFFTTKNVAQGFGMGLASVYGIIKNHGGFINVYSEKDKGTTFNIYLPASERETLGKSVEVKQNKIQYGQGTVLLVDDEKMIAEVGQAMLEKLGYKVFTAESGQKALDLYEKKKDEIDLVILDMIMPGMGGEKTLDRMKRMGGDSRILLSSGYSISQKTKEILDRGCSGFIQKPFTMEKISRKVHEALKEDKNSYQQ